MRFGRKRPQSEAPAEVTTPVAPSYAPGSGPFDHDDSGIDPEEFAAAGLLDLGGVLLPPPPPGYEVHVQADQETGAILGLLLMGPESGLELAASARGRTTEAWRERRVQLAEEVAAAGGSTAPEEGPSGDELLCVVPVVGEGGEQTTSGARFIGFEGPRWLLVGTLHGRAANDLEAAEPLRQVFHSVVVRRGSQAMPNGEPIGLRLPTEEP